MTATILLCDDESHILRAAEFKFKRAGFSVRCANDGQEAWELIQQEPPDILVTDFQMPRMNGMQLVERLRKHPPTADMPVVMLTAKGFELQESQLQSELRITKLVSKPFSPRELLMTVVQIVEQSVVSAAVGG